MAAYPTRGLEAMLTYTSAPRDPRAWTVYEPTVAGVSAALRRVLEVLDCDYPEESGVRPYIPDVWPILSWVREVAADDGRAEWLLVGHDQDGLWACLERGPVDPAEVIRRVEAAERTEDTGKEV